MSKVVVFDSSAIIAFLIKERGWEQVEPLLDGGLMSTVNVCEVVSKFAERGFDAGQVALDIGDLGLEILDFDIEQARLAGELRPTTKSLGLSLGDRACLALGLMKKAEVYTADQAWATLTAPHQIHLLR